MNYAAANIAPILVRNGRLGELPYDKIPVGRGERSDCLTLHELNHQKGDLLYVYRLLCRPVRSTEREKYMYENLNQKLAKINGYDPMKQRVELSHEFTYWKGALEQVEDVCVPGIRI